MRFSSIVVLCFLGIAPITGWSQSEELERYVLPNGLTVILNEDHTMPQVFGAVAVKVGSKHDPADATGLAHYQEHMLFKGTTTLGTTNWEAEKVFIDSIFLMYDELRKTKGEEERTKIQKSINRLSVAANDYAIPNEFDNLTKMMGGTGLNAFTAFDMTVYFNAFPGNQIERWLELYAHRFREPVFRSFQAELEVVYEEKNMRSDNFFLKIFEEFHSNMFKGHPYGTQTAIGTIEHLKNPSLTKMLEFFKTYYVPNNMVLVISGDFDPEPTKKFIEKSWGGFERKALPEFPAYKKHSFSENVVVEKKLSPIKLGALGFHTVEKGHPDELKLELLHAIMTNSSQSGLLDKLALDKELMGAGLIPLNYLDQGATLLFFIPKIAGQKHTEAESLVMSQFDKIKSGDFEDWILEAAKNQLYIQNQQSLESNESLVLALVDAEVAGIDPKDVFRKNQLIKNITKADIMAVVEKYYRPNHLSFYSSMGIPKKEKIEKPEYEPVVSKNESKSEFYEELVAIKPGEANIDFIDFNEDISSVAMNGGSVLHYIENPKNDIFSLDIRFMVGDETIPLLNQTSDMLGYAGAGELEVKDLKDQFNRLGASYSFSSSKNYFTMSISGMEENLDDILTQVNLILTKPKLSDDELDVLVDNAKSDRKIEQSQPEEIASALFSYIRYGEKSSYLDRLTLKELKALTAVEILDAFKKAQEYEVQMHYVGQKGAKAVSELIAKKVTLADNPKKGLVPFYKPVEKITENKVYFVNKKSARQSKVYFSVSPFYFDKNQDAQMDAFNMYFGGGFSGLVVQEIREYRSLAYNAGANVVRPESHEFPCQFYGVLGTQSDKTTDAVGVFWDLLREMPQKTERIEFIKEFLINEAQTDQPNFRSMSKYIVARKYQGYVADPRMELLQKYGKLEFEDIMTYYEQHLKTKPMAIAVAGDKRQVDLDALAKYGEVVKLKPKQLFSK